MGRAQHTRIIVVLIVVDCANHELPLLIFHVRQEEEWRESEHKIARNCHFCRVGAFICTRARVITPRNQLIAKLKSVIAFQLASHRLSSSLCRWRAQKWSPCVAVVGVSALFGGKGRCAGVMTRSIKCYKHVLDGEVHADRAKCLQVHCTEDEDGWGAES